MTARRRTTYPAYKDSGVEWLGRVPAHWQVKRLKEIASVRLSNVDKKSVEGQEPVRLCNYVDVYYHDRITPDMEFMPATASHEQTRRFALRAGDVLITKDSESWTDIAVPALVTEDMPDVLCGYHLALIRPEAGCVGAYLGRAFSARGLRDQFQVAANGITRFGLGADAIATGAFPVPPEAEQRSIAAFLDRETARIDALVAKKERLIELLTEKRASVISLTVTKGVRPNVPMKYADVGWLGQMPVHWGVKPLKHLVPWVTVGIVVTPSKYYVDRGVPCLRSLNISAGRIDMDDLVYISQAANQLHAKSIIHEGDVVVVRTGESGTAAVVPAELEGTNCIDLLIVRRSEQLHPKFVYYYLNSSAATYQAELTSVGAIQAHYNTSTLANLLVPVIPLVEQEAIVQRLDEQTQLIDAMVAKVGKAIQQLQELRSALVSAAVTGQVDLRDGAA